MAEWHLVEHRQPSAKQNKEQRHQNIGKTVGVHFFCGMNPFYIIGSNPIHDYNKYITKWRHNYISWPIFLFNLSCDRSVQSDRSCVFWFFWTCIIVQNGLNPVMKNHKTVSCWVFTLDNQSACSICDVQTQLAYSILAASSRGQGQNDRAKPAPPDKPRHRP